MPSIYTRIQNAIDAYNRKDYPGQRDLFTGEVRKQEKTQGKLRWITLHDSNGNGTTHVQIGDDGTIHSGPEGLKGKNLNHLGRKAESHEIPAAKPKENPGEAFLKKSDSGRKVGNAMMHIDDLDVDPTRFQYKVKGIDASTGTNAELKRVKEYNPELGGQLLVWHDQENGKSYVINGHHRYELAKRSPRSDELGKFSGQVPVYYVNAKNHMEARARGALANIAEGRGTATDAAKFMRDMDVGLEDFAKSGVSPSGAVAQAALDLKRLSPALFQKLSNGMITEHRAQTIGKYLENQDAQDQLFHLIEKREKPKKPWSDDKVAEMCRTISTMKGKDVNGEGKNQGGNRLFDDWFKEFPIEQRADVTEYVRRNLSSEHRILKDASSSKRKEALEGVGENKLDTEVNREHASAAELRADDFDHQANASGHPIAIALDQFAERLYREPKRKDAIVKEALAHVKALLDGSDQGSPKAEPASEVGNVGRVPDSPGNRGDQERRIPSHEEITRMSRVDRAARLFKYSKLMRNL